MQELVSQQLWTDYHPYRIMGLPLGRRLTVARNAAGGLIVFSPLQATPKRLHDLRALGEPVAFVLPNRMHDLFYEDYFAAFPTAVFLAGPAVIADHPGWPLRLLEAEHPALAGFRYLELAGMPQVRETVFLHEATKTLIIADALFNLPRPENWLTRQWMKLADMGGRPRPSRLFRSLIKSPADFRASLEVIHAWDFNRILGGHGDIIVTDAQANFRAAFEGI